MDSEDNFIFEDLSIVNDRREGRKKKFTKYVKILLKRIPIKILLNYINLIKKTAGFIVNLIRDDLSTTHDQRGSPISIEVIVMATIRYIAKGSYQKDIGDVRGLSQQTMSRIIKKIGAALAQKIHNFIKFPLEPMSLKKIKEGFYNIAQFPQCISAIDCTHIKIKNPGGELGGRHRCRKGFCSTNVQLRIEN